MLIINPINTIDINEELAVSDPDYTLLVSALSATYFLIVFLIVLKFS